MSKSFKVDLLIIDPQQDFCNPKGFPYEGTLYVKGAENDMDRLTKFVKRSLGKFNDIHVTLDSHHSIDIGHAAYWRDSKGNRLDPFSCISADDLKSGKVRTFIPSLQRRAEKYADELNKSGRYPMIVWPTHCLIGTPGHNVYLPLAEALREWEDAAGAVVDYVTKGANPHTEHYSAIKAEVPDPTDETTQLNARLIDALTNVDEVAIAGEALSHCVANTVRDIATAFKNADYVKKLVLLEDCSSPVPNSPGGPDFEKMASDFVSDMKKLGMRVAKSTDYLK